MQLADLRASADRIRKEIAKAIVGQSDTVDLMLTALFAGGHILLEGPPGHGQDAARAMLRAQRSTSSSAASSSRPT